MRLTRPTWLVDGIPVATVLKYTGLTPDDLDSTFQED